jgi:exopolyphosphatase/guanosine-5'-triphosphate,3'-diphosphate pyrophosphatase
MSNFHNKLAAIDIGTNSFHLIIVSVKENGDFEIIDREKEVIRLGEGSGGDIKLIKEDAQLRAIQTLKRFKGIADSHQAVIKAVATSAVRESQNKIEFIKRVFELTGIEIETISGNEEARLIYLGVLRAVPVFDKKVLVIDIGGGSTELLVGEKGNTLYSTSLKLGAVRLTQRFFPNYEIDTDSINACRKLVELELINVAESIKIIGFDSSVGSSGTIMSTGLMIEASQKGKLLEGTILNNYEFNRKDFAAIRDEILERKTPARRKKISGLDVKRADIIPAGIIILDEIINLFDLKRMTISGYALREGIVIDILDKTIDDRPKLKLNDIRKNSVMNLAKSCRYNLDHCMHVASLALSLFDQLQEIHNLDNFCREYLEYAAILHDIGYHISASNHHYHSFYIIKNSELLGFNENEINIIAHTARYHRKSHPKESHEDFITLPEKTQTIIKKLASILRVADALDRIHKKVVNSVDVSVSNDEVLLKLENETKANLDIELWNLDRRKILFEEVFKRKIITEIIPN